MHCWDEEGWAVIVSTGLLACGFRVNVRTSLEERIRGDSLGLACRGYRLFGKLLCRLRGAFGAAIFVAVMDGGLLVIQFRRDGRT